MALQRRAATLRLGLLESLHRGLEATSNSCLILPPSYSAHFEHGQSYLQRHSFVLLASLSCVFVTQCIPFACDAIPF